MTSKIMNWRNAAPAVFWLAFLLCDGTSSALELGGSPADGAAAAAAPEAVEAEDLPGPPVPVPSPPPSRAMLGVYVTSPGTAGDFRLPLIVAQGCQITSIVPGSPADRAGLPIGGTIVGFDGRPIGSPADLARWVRAATPGQNVELQYVLAGQVFRKTVQLAPSPLAIDQAQSPLPQPELQLRADPNSLPPFREGSGRLANPYAPQSEPSPQGSLPAAGVSTAIGELRRQVEELQRQVGELQDKLAELEKKLAAESP